jgi:thiamine pyrophosphate-dependent acetolactate synthase large subunit-like protein
VADEKSTSRAGTDRRSFLKGASLGGVGIMAAASAAPVISAQSTPSSATTAATGSDLMVDVLRNLGIRHVAQIPGSTFAGLQESLINHGMLTEPAMRMFTVTHEEIAVAFAHGYAKVANQPMACMVHSVVGLQHASMAIYNAYCDRAPVITLTGSLTNPEARESFVDWMHAVSDGPAITRDYTKFDETPRSLSHFIEATTRAYQAAMTPPMGPVVIAADLDLQQNDAPQNLSAALVKPPRITAPQGESGAVREAARLKIQHQCSDRNRGLTRGTIGCDLPSIDYRKIAEGFGIDGQRVTDPNDLRAAIAHGIDVVRRGEPAVIDVVSQGR